MPERKEQNNCEKGTEEKKREGWRECMEGKMISAVRKGRKKRRMEGMHGRKEQKNCEKRTEEEKDGGKAWKERCCEKGTEEEKDGGNAWEERAKEL